MKTAATRITLTEIQDFLIQGNWVKNKFNWFNTGLASTVSVELNATFALIIRSIFLKNFLYCCDPLKLHKSTIKSCQKALNLNDIVEFEHVELIPGNRYCVWGCNKLEEHNQFNEPDDTYPYYKPVESSLPDVEGFKNYVTLWNITD